MFTIYGGKTEFQQWDLDQLVTNECMKAGDEVVFRNAHGETYVVKAFEQDGAILADVPNYLLMKDGNILVDLEQGLEHHTDCRTTFNVIAREKPEGYNCECNIPNRETNNNGGGSGGGADSVTVTFTYADEDQHDLIADKTLEELAELYRSGKKIDAVLYTNDGFGDNYWLHCLGQASFEDDTPSFLFSSAWTDGVGIMSSTIEYNTAYNTGEVQCYITWGELYPPES